MLTVELELTISIDIAMILSPLSVESLHVLDPYRSVLLCHENGKVIVITLSPRIITPPVGQNVASEDQAVKIKAETRIYPSSLVKYCQHSCQLAVCGGSNIVKVLLLIYSTWKTVPTYVNIATSCRFLFH